MLEPLVSCVLTTCTQRHDFLNQAIKYYNNQTYPNRELIIVNDDPDAATYPLFNCIKLGQNTNIGTKLNIGIDAAKGILIQKLDDDDFYAPTFLESMVSSIMNSGHNLAIGAMNSAPVYLVKEKILKFSGYSGWFFGNSFCFHKEVWQRKPFRDVATKEDTYFLEDHIGTDSQRIVVNNTELMVILRHGRNHLRQKVQDLDFDNFFLKHRNDYHKTLDEIVGQENYKFYKAL